jgi:exonuclease-1
MGIKGILPQLKSITTDVHVEMYKGMRVGIDIFVWLHKGGYSCARELAEGKSTNKYVEYCMDLINMLKKNGVVDIIVVLDGSSLPAKGLENKSRREKREQKLALGNTAKEQGHDELALKHYQQSISITKEMVQQLILALRAAGIEFMVSPYEADAQLAFLSKSGDVDLVISEDSDLLVYGCKRVLYKLDFNGNGQEIIRRRLGENTDMTFLNWNDSQFKLFCCLAGCDYHVKIKGLGLKKSHAIVAKCRTFLKVADELRRSWNSKVS